MYVTLVPYFCLALEMAVLAVLNLRTTISERRFDVIIDLNILIDIILLSPKGHWYDWVSKYEIDVECVFGQHILENQVHKHKIALVCVVQPLKMEDKDGPHEDTDHSNDLIISQGLDQNQQRYDQILNVLRDWNNSEDIDVDANTVTHRIRPAFAVERI